MMSQSMNMCVKKASVKMHRKCLFLAVKLNVIKHIEAGEHQLNVCEVLDLAGLRA
jgi:hypothetical protein